MAFADWEIRGVLRRLSGQPCTPPGTPRDLVRYVKNEGLATFLEWPSGHWKITERGASFMADTAVADARDEDVVAPPIIVSAVYSFTNRSRGMAEERETLTFLTDSEEAAVADFGRWWRDRHANLGDWFGALLAVKFYRVQPQRIDSNGGMRPDTSLPFMEWCIDHPGPSPFV